MRFKEKLSRFLFLFEEFAPIGLVIGGIGVWLGWPAAAVIGGLLWIGLNRIS